MTPWTPSFAALTLGIAALLAGPASARASQEGALPVSAQVVDGCSVAAQPLIFGVAPGTTGAVRSTTQIRLACTPGIPYDVAIDHGRNPNGVNRRMLNATTGDYLRYRIFSDPAYSRVWSDKRNETIAGNSGAAGTASLTVYGEIPQLGAISSGTYRDTVTVTVNF